MCSNFDKNEFKTRLDMVLKSDDKQARALFPEANSESNCKNIDMWTPYSAGSRIASSAGIALASVAVAMIGAFY